MKQRAKLRHGISPQRANDCAAFSTAEAVSRFFRFLRAMVVHRLVASNEVQYGHRRLTKETKDTNNCHHPLDLSITVSL
jgi:hypothetical protein